MARQTHFLQKVSLYNGFGAKTWRAFCDHPPSKQMKKKRQIQIFGGRSCSCSKNKMCKNLKGGAIHLHLCCRFICRGRHWPHFRCCYWVCAFFGKRFCGANNKNQTVWFGTHLLFMELLEPCHVQKCLCGAFLNLFKDEQLLKSQWPHIKKSTWLRVWQRWHDLFKLSQSFLKKKHQHEESDKCAPSCTCQTEDSVGSALENFQSFSAILVRWTAWTRSLALVALGRATCRARCGPAEAWPPQRWQCPAWHSWKAKQQANFSLLTKNKKNGWGLSLGNFHSFIWVPMLCWNSHRGGLFFRLLSYTIQ